MCFPSHVPALDSVREGRCRSRHIGLQWMVVDFLGQLGLAALISMGLEARKLLMALERRCSAVLVQSSRAASSGRVGGSDVELLHG